MVYINDSTCARCGACEQVCPQYLFSWKKKEIAQYDVDHDGYCIHCGHCYAVCPSGSISLDGVKAADMPAVQKAPLEPLQRDMLFRTRRSVRAFSSEKVPHAVLNEALLDASYAPTATNKQNVIWTLVENPNRIQSIIAETVDWLRSSQYRAYLELYEAGKDVVLRGAHQAIFAHTPSAWGWGPQDATAALSYLELSLHTRGIGACWTGLVKAAANAGAVPALELPVDHSLHGGLMLGYPAVRYARVPVRKDVRLTIL